MCAMAERHELGGARGEGFRDAQLRLLESLDRIEQAMRGSSDVEATMESVLDAALSIFSCDRAWLLTPCDPDAAAWKVPFERTRRGFPGARETGIEVAMTPKAAAFFRRLLRSLRKEVPRTVCGPRAA